MRQQLAARPAVAVLAGQRAAVATDQRRGRRRRIGERASAPSCEREVDAHVHAAVAEVPVDQPVEAVLAHQRVELAQVGRQVLGRDGGVLPARPGRRAGGRAAAEPGAVLADAPQRARSRAGDDRRVEAAGVGDQLLGGARPPRPRVAPDVSTNSQPSPRGRSAPPTARAGCARPSTSRASMPSSATGRVRQQRRHRLGGRRHVRVTEHRQRDGRRRLDQPRPSRAVSTASVPSVPTRNFARSAPFSGSRCSSE